MRGCEALTTDGRTRVTWVLETPRDAPRAPISSVSAGVGESTATLRARLIAAVVELASEGSNPRLNKMRNAPFSL